MINSKLYHIYPTMKCNLNCQHCFLHEEVRAETTQMSDTQFRHIVDQLGEDFQLDSSVDFAEVTIIGGEPTLVSPNFYKRNIPYLKKVFTKGGKKISLTIVSNFTSINSLDRYYEFFDVISTSYEWDRFDSKTNIKLNDNKKERWWKNVREWLSRGKPLAISIATTTETINNWEQMFEMLYAEGVRFFQVNLMHPDGELMKNILHKEDYAFFDKHRTNILTKPALKNSIFFKTKDNALWPSFQKEAEFLIKLSEWVTQKQDQNLIVYPINSHIESIKNKTSNSDISCPASNAICVTTKGEVSSCTIESGKQNMLSYGNIFESDLKKIIKSDLRINHISALGSKPTACYGCNYYYFCQGGCSFRELFWDKQNKNTECHGLKSYFKYLEKRIKENE